jgi:Sulfotransferase domain
VHDVGNRVTELLPVPVRGAFRRWESSAVFAGRTVTAGKRSWPDFVILGAMRGGTTSLYRWMSTHPGVTPAFKKEVHYFDRDYERGERWYRAHFPLQSSTHVTGEASPYMLFHPLAPERAARDLPADTKLVVLLRDPVERAISHYWHNRELGLWETESLELAIELEPQRLAGTEARVRRGERVMEHQAFSYVARGEYAGQVRRWFDAVGRDRVLVVESEQLYVDAGAANELLAWLGLPPHDSPYPRAYGAERLDENEALVVRLREHFEPHNQELFDLLGRQLWLAPPTPATKATEPVR